MEKVNMQEREMIKEENIMYEQLMDEIKKELEKIVPQGSKVEYRVVTKNNGVKLQAVNIKEPGKNIVPTIYIDDVLKCMVHGSMTATEAAVWIQQNHKKGQIYNPFGADVCLCKETILDCVEYQIVNRDKNNGLLQEIPHREFLDLAVVYRVVVTKDKLRMASILIDNGIMQAFDICIEELEEAAKKNTENQGFVMKSLESEVAEMVGKPDGNDNGSKVFMYVCSNRAKINGATVMLYEKCFKSLAEIADDDLYILPSSIHECIAVKATSANAHVLREMVVEVNRTQVEDEEVLSNNVYKYSRTKGVIEVA